jgi:hypothetical protein
VGGGAGDGHDADDGGSGVAHGGARGCLIGRRGEGAFQAARCAGAMARRVRSCWLRIAVMC